MQVQGRGRRMEAYQLGVAVLPLDSPVELELVVEFA
jgi:hypothetical protein